MDAFDQSKRNVLLKIGIKLSKDGKSVFNYNPAYVQAGLNFLLAEVLLPGFINNAHLLQMLVLLVIQTFVCWYPGITWKGEKLPDGKREILEVNVKIIHGCWASLLSLTRFVLGLFVSLSIAKTYYSNRGMFGTVFGSSMGLAQMVAAWVRAPDSQDSTAKTQANTARQLIVRWINAAFRLMWLEAIPGKTPLDMQAELLDKGLLTEKEWAYIESLPSRCTHIYQWINNVILDLREAGFITSYDFVITMNNQVDQMRGANVWGLPSLPITYTLVITNMVKLALLMTAINNGSALAAAFDAKNDFSSPHYFSIALIYLDTIFMNYLFQGLLDLHGALYSPCSGVLLGHLPALNFMDFVRQVTEDLVKTSPDEPKSLPYTLELGPELGPKLGPKRRLSLAMEAMEAVEEAAFLV